MIRKIISPFILLVLLFTSCLDDFEPRISSFTKMYGANLDANMRGVFATNDNGFLLYGSMDKSTFNDPNSTGGVLTIIKTDELGNEMWTSSIGLSTVSFKNNPFVKGTTLEISTTGVKNIIELENGYFFAAVNMLLPALDYRAPGYIVLSPSGKVLEYNTFMDNVSDPSYPKFLVRHQPYAP